MQQKCDAGKCGIIIDNRYAPALFAQLFLNWNQNFYKLIRFEKYTS